AAAFLPGALVGTHLAGLIFFLNPELPFGFAALGRGIAVYGLLLGVAGAVVSLPWLWRRPRRARRWLPWGITLALAAAALLDWGHASHYAFYLPPGINRRLIKAAAALSAAALIAFYTALLHALARRRYGPRSRLAYLALALVSVAVMVERRDAFRPGPPPSPRPSLVEPTNRPKLLVVGIEGATHDAVLPLAGQGRLPFLAAVLEGGAYARLGSLAPHRRQALWITLATGKLPYKHGLLADAEVPAPLLGPGAALEVLPAGLGFSAWGTFGQEPRPLDGAESEALALWRVLPRLGVASGVIGWPGSHPAAAEPVFAVSDRYFAAPSAPGAALPPALAAQARLFRFRPEEVDPPLLGAGDGPLPPRVERALAADLWREGLASMLLSRHRRLDALFIQLDGLGAVSRADLGGYQAAQFEAAQGEAYQQAARRIAAYYAHLDLFLSRLWERTPPPKLLAVVSAYGTEAPEGWRRVWREIGPGDPLGADFAGSPDGVLMLYGEGIQPGVLLTGAELVDVVPTLAYGLGLPIARDLDGQVLTGAFRRSFLAGHPLTFLPSYETLEEVAEPAREGR
ncbi:MAG TPA: alkaline phosphatase family protein, partial [Thermoanaerobaculia bacterium]|nr:alkaline phosphatase family protein [Thermoanaerobaculia bacterium]